jgi:hypothetical protein
VRRRAAWLCLILTGCSISPESFNEFCRSNYRIEIQNPEAWRTYLGLLANESDKGNGLKRLQEIGEFRIEGHAAPQPGPPFFPEPVQNSKLIYKGDLFVASIVDFWSSHVSDENGEVVTCSTKVPELWLRAR